MSGSDSSGKPAAPGAAPDGSAQPFGAPRPSRPGLRNEASPGISLADASRELGERRRQGRQGRPAPRGAAAQAVAAATAPAATPAAQAPARPGQAPAQAAAPAQEGAARAPEGGKPDPFQTILQALTPRQQPEPGAARPATAVSNGADGTAPAAPATEAGDRITLVIGGKAQGFTPSELAQHVSQAQDYTQKTQRLAGFAREVQTAQAALNEVLPLVMPMLQAQLGNMEANLGPEPDWVKLAETDPGAYAIQRARWDRALAERGKLQQLMQTQQRQTDSESKRRLTEGHKELASALPGWSDPVTRGAIQTELVKWGRTNGFPDHELRTVYEPRHVLTLAKAMMFDRLMSGVSTEMPNIPVVQRGSINVPASAAVSVAEERFAETPSAKNAAQLLTARRRAQH